MASKRAKQLAALAADASTTEHERAAAARALAKLIAKGDVDEPPEPEPSPRWGGTGHGPWGEASRRDSSYEQRFRQADADLQAREERYLEEEEQQRRADWERARLEALKK